MNRCRYRKFVISWFSNGGDSLMSNFELNTKYVNIQLAEGPSLCLNTLCTDSRSVPLLPRIMAVLLEKTKRSLHIHPTTTHNIRMYRPRDIHINSPIRLHRQGCLRF